MKILWFLYRFEHENIALKCILKLVNPLQNGGQVFYPLSNLNISNSFNAVFYSILSGD